MCMRNGTRMHARMTATTTTPADDEDDLRGVCVCTRHVSGGTPRTSCVHTHWHLKSRTVFATPRVIDDGGGAVFLPGLAFL